MTTPEHDTVLSITYVLADTVPFRPDTEPPGTGKFGGTHHPTWPLPKPAPRLVDPREIEREHAAPGPQLNWPLGRRGVGARLRAWIRRIA